MQCNAGEFYSSIPCNRWWYGIFIERFTLIQWKVGRGVGSSKLAVMTHPRWVRGQGRGRSEYHLKCKSNSLQSWTGHGQMARRHFNVPDNTYMYRSHIPEFKLENWAKMKDVHQIAHICAFLLIAPLVKNLLTLSAIIWKSCFKKRKGYQMGRLATVCTRWRQGSLRWQPTMIYI